MYQSTIDNCIPFHKFYQYIKSEVKKFTLQKNSKVSYNKNKLESVLNFISSKLF